MLKEKCIPLNDIIQRKEAENQSSKSLFQEVRERVAYSTQRKKEEKKNKQQKLIKYKTNT